MLKTGINLKLGVPLLVITFIVSGLALFGGAQLVKQDKATAATGVVDGGGGAGPGPGPVAVTLVAQNILYDLKTITANAGEEVTITLDNRDAGVLHNVAVYTDRSASQQIVAGAIITGPATEDVTFTAPASPGTYYFRCDVHPDTMNGAFVVQ